MTTAVTVTDAVTGAPVAGVTVAPGDVQGTGTAAGVITLSASSSSTTARIVTLNAAGYVPRSFSVKVPGAASTVTMIPTTFNLTAFDELMRVTQLTRWASNPPLRMLTRVVQFTGLQQADAAGLNEVMTTAELDGLQADLADGLSALTGGRHTAFASVTRQALTPGERADVLVTGVITVARYVGLSAETGFAGYARWHTLPNGTVTGGTIMLDRDRELNDEASVVRLVRMHELGHALGYTHVTQTDSVMNVLAVPPTAFDRQATGIAFQRPPGNMRPDADPTSVSLNTLSAGVWSRGDRE